MKIKPCKRCQNVDVFGRYQYCPNCKEIVEKENKERQKAQKREIYKQKIGGEYKYNKNYGLESTPPKALRGTSPATRRWAKMSWYDLCKELDYYKLKYREAQIMAQNGTLPADFGLKHKEVSE